MGEGVPHLINETSTVLRDYLESYATQCVDILKYILLYNNGIISRYPVLREIVRQLVNTERKVFRIFLFSDR